MNPHIHKYLEELLRDAGQIGLGKELENQMIEDLYSRLEDRFIVTALSYLNLDQQAELEKMGNLKGKKLSGEIETFFKKNIPNYDQIFAQALMDFRNLYIEASKG